MKQFLTELSRTTTPEEVRKVIIEYLIVFGVEITALSAVIYCILYMFNSALNI